MKPSVPSFALSAALVIFTAAGCGRNTVKVYHVDSADAAAAPTVPPPATPAAAMSGEIPVPDNSGLPKLKYTLPAGWTEKPLTQMRVASFEISANGKSVDVSVIPLGGMAGGDLANVNRWRGQVSLQPLADNDLQNLAEKVEVAGQAADLFDIAGTDPGSGDAERIVGVILHRNDTAWFFKMTGDPALAETNKPAFVTFLKSLQFDTSAASAAPDMSKMDMSQLPPSHPPIGGMDMGGMMGGANAAATPTWTVPDGWQKGPLEQFLVAKFVIPGANNAKAEVNVSALAGDGGGLLPNVNRWRQQLGLAPVGEADLSKLATLDVAGGKATVVEVAGASAGLVGVVLPLGGQTWFYKLMGDPGVVAQQKDAFLKFVQSAKYPTGGQN